MKQQLLVKLAAAFVAAVIVASGCSSSEPQPGDSAVTTTTSSESPGKGGASETTDATLGTALEPNATRTIEQLAGWWQFDGSSAPASRQLQGFYYLWLRPDLGTPSSGTGSAGFTLDALDQRCAAIGAGTADLELDPDLLTAVLEPVVNSLEFVPCTEEPLQRPIQSWLDTCFRRGCAFRIEADALIFEDAESSQVAKFSRTSDPRG